MLFKRAQKVTKHLGYFWKKICSQELSKIAQSGHTEIQNVELLLLFNSKVIPDRIQIIRKYVNQAKYNNNHYNNNV